MTTTNSKCREILSPDSDVGRSVPLQNAHSTLTIDTVELQTEIETTIVITIIDGFVILAGLQLLPVDSDGNVTDPCGHSAEPFGTIH